ncbi:hypothetical protein CO650_08485 [Rhizobium phaseoli]|nr:hypothetical protein CO650_08485 [Rhizobium phaseoli]PWI54739.1 hypothetical protein B5K03_08420 [Rhizobium phaseoli]
MRIDVAPAAQCLTRLTRLDAIGTHVHKQQETDDANFGCGIFCSGNSDTGGLYDDFGWHYHGEQEPYCG